MIHHGVASVLREHVKEFEKSTSAELDTLLIGQRVAKQFPMSDQDGDHVYRGSVACVHGGGPGFPYGIRYDDGDTEDMNAVELYGMFACLECMHDGRFNSVSQSSCFLSSFLIFRGNGTLHSGWREG